MSTQTERVKKSDVNELIKEHSSLNRAKAGNANDQREQNARVKEIRQELVQIFHAREEK